MGCIIGSLASSVILVTQILCDHELFVIVDRRLSVITAYESINQ